MYTANNSQANVKAPDAEKDKFSDFIGLIGTAQNTGGVSKEIDQEN